jgi:hypothetical protein
MKASGVPSRPGRLAAAVMSALSLAVIYYTAAILWNALSTAWMLPVRLPVDFFVGGLFNVFPVFTHYESVNTDVVIEGLREGAAGEEASWVELPVGHYLPFRPGELQARVLAPIQVRFLGADGTQSYLTLARKIQSRHNRLHPERVLQQVRLRALSWPRSPDGYRALKQPELIETRELCITAPG